MSSPVLDASALLAYLHDEPGADAVTDAIADGAWISTVNLAEVLSRAADRGVDPEKLFSSMRGEGLLEGAITLEPFTKADAIDVARGRPVTRRLGLSIGDRACLALARRLDAEALTADSSWSQADVGVEVRQIR